MISKGLCIFSCVLDGMLDLDIQRYKQKLTVFKRSPQSKKWGEDLKKWSQPFLLQTSGLRGKVSARFGGEADMWVGQFCITKMTYTGQAHFIKEGIWLDTNCTVLSLGIVHCALGCLPSRQGIMMRCVWQGQSVHKTKSQSNGGAELTQKNWFLQEPPLSFQRQLPP